MNKAQRTYAIMELVKNKYTELGMRDSDFAEYASQTLGISVKRASITVARANLGIANNQPRGEDLKELLNDIIHAVTLPLDLDARVRAALGPGGVR